MTPESVRYQHPRPTPRPPLAYGPLQFQSRYLLSPLAGFTNLEFRLIVRELGGAIEVQSTPNQGTTFTIRFSLDKKQPK